MIEPAKRFSSVILTLFMAGCAVLNQGGRPVELPDVLIGDLVIFNNGQAWVSAARILVQETGRFVSCSNIAPGNRCATGIPEQLFTGNPVEVTWSQEGAIFSTGELQLTLPEAAVASGRARIQVWIMGPGSAGVEIVAVSEP